MRVVQAITIFFSLLLIGSCVEKGQTALELEGRSVLKGETIMVLSRIDTYEDYSLTGDINHKWVRFEYNDRRRAVLKEPRIEEFIASYTYHIKPDGYTMMHLSSGSFLRMASRITPTIVYCTYSSDGRLYQELWDQEAEGEIVLNILYSYDEMGRLVKKMNNFQEGTFADFESSWHYDSEGQLVRMVDLFDHNSSTVEEYQYGKKGELLACQRAHYYNLRDGSVRQSSGLEPYYSNRYDSSGRLVRMDLGYWVRLYDHDSDGNIGTESFLRSDGEPDKSSYIIHYRYDHHGNVIERVEDEGADGSINKITLYYYTSDGKRVLKKLNYGPTLDSLKHITTYSYDLSGNLIKLERASGAPEEIYSTTFYTYEKIELID